MAGYLHCECKTEMDSIAGCEHKHSSEYKVRARTARRCRRKAAKRIRRFSNGRMHGWYFYCVICAEAIMRNPLVWPDTLEQEGIPSHADLG